MSKNSAERSGSVAWDATQATDMAMGTLILVGCFALVCLFMVAAN